MARFGGRSRVMFGAAALAILVLAATCQPPGPGPVTTQTFQIGPFDLQPGQDLSTNVSNIPRPAGNFGLKEMRFDVVDGNGDSVPRHHVHLHHIVTTNSARSDVACPRPERFGGAGMERTPIVLPDEYQYLVGADDQWGAILELVNTMNMPMSVYVEYELVYQPNSTPETTRPVTPYFLDVTGCGGSAFNVPADSDPEPYVVSRTWNARSNGRVVFVGGHQHQGGIDITLRDDTANAAICTATVTYDEMGMIDSINSCTPDYPMTKGQPYTVVARYDNAEAQIGQMGIMLTYAWETP